MNRLLYKYERINIPNIFICLMPELTDIPYTVTGYVHLF